MQVWNPAHYLKFDEERTRPAADLLARIKVNAPNSIVDLGCGPGNSTQLLQARWPGATLTGVDNSPEMIATAKASRPEIDWAIADIRKWSSDVPVDLVFSNAALQWIPHHESLVLHLLKSVSTGGALAFQIPRNKFATIRTLIHELSRDPSWSDRMESARNALTMESPAFYYDALVAKTTSLDIWETEYFHIMDSKESIVDWIASTGLRPFLAALESDAERLEFITKLRQRVDATYELRDEGKVLFPFHRTFVIAYR